jgi:hypothetical protein
MPLGDGSLQVIVIGGFEIHTTVMKSSIFWDITHHIPMKISGRLKRKYLLHLHG